MHQNNADLIRPGCRGGHDQFNWESLRTMKYHDREQYLGQTTVIGYLDKGGKWRKKDWYIKPEERNLDQIKLDDELQKIKEEDERRLRAALGQEPQEDQKVQQVRLTKEELAELTKKSKIDIDDQHNKQGLGSGALTKTNFNSSVKGTNLLEAYGTQDDYRIKKEENVEGIDKQIKKQDKKKEKKEKKNKKEKKERKEKKKEKKNKNKDQKK